MAIAGESIKFPASIGGVRYIVIVTQEAIETAAGASVSKDEMAPWVIANIDFVMEIVDRVRPKPTLRGARVYVKSDQIKASWPIIDA